MSLPKVLLVDDDEIHRESVRRMLGDSVHLHEVPTGAQALAAIANTRFDYVVLDNRLPDYTAVELLPLLNPHDQPVLVLTAMSTPELVSAVRRLGARACLQKDQLTRTQLHACVCGNETAA